MSDHTKTLPFDHLSPLAIADIDAMFTAEATRHDLERQADTALATADPSDLIGRRGVVIGGEHCGRKCEISNLHSGYFGVFLDDGSFATIHVDDVQAFLRR